MQLLERERVCMQLLEREELCCNERAAASRARSELSSACLHAAAGASARSLTLQQLQQQQQQAAGTQLSLYGMHSRRERGVASQEVVLMATHTHTHTHTHAWLRSRCCEARAIAPAAAAPRLYSLLSTPMPASSRLPPDLQQLQRRASALYAHACFIKTTACLARAACA